MEVHQRNVQGAAPVTPSTPAPASVAKSKAPSRNKPKEFTQEEIERWETEKEVISYEYSPSTLTAWRLFLLVQVLAAFYNYISDCDEVFNYWEPMHFMQHGRGLQTWEYSPQWSLRSYFYLLPQLIVASIFEVLEANKLVQFYAVRVFLGFVTALCQTYFYDRIRTFFRGRIAFMTMIFMLVSPGFFVAGTAFLPSSFAMCCMMLAHGLWMDKRPSFFAATFMVATAALIGWPFAAMVGVPLAFDAMRKAGIFKFILYAMAAGILILVPSVLFDSWYYGKTVIASYNIIHYNVLGQVEGGSALYGVESWTWYIKNTLVNFNLVILFAALSLPVTVISTGIRLRAKDVVRSALLQFGVYLWLVFMSAIPHKEERFLFVIYGPLCLAGAIGFVGFFDFIFEVLHKCFSQGFASRVAGFGAIIVAVVIVSLSISRTYSLAHNYSAPLKVYGDLSRVLEGDDCWEGQEQINICVGKEWYRYTSSYFFPGNRFNLTFIDQGPTSHLPQYFPASSRHILPNFNAYNREEPSRYIPLKNCHFVVDYDPEGKGLNLPASDWALISTYPFLEQSRSPNPLLRAFFVPVLSERSNKFGSYQLYQRTNQLTKNLSCRRSVMDDKSIIRPSYAPVVRGVNDVASELGSERIEPNSQESERQNIFLAQQKKHQEELRRQEEEKTRKEQEAQAAAAKLAEAKLTEERAAEKAREEEAEKRRLVEEFELKAQLEHDAKMKREQEDADRAHQAKIQEALAAETVPQNPPAEEALPVGDDQVPADSKILNPEPLADPSPSPVAEAKSEEVPKEAAETEPAAVPNPESVPEEQAPQKAAPTGRQKKGRGGRGRY